jgi:Domain of unknown function (DUF6531)
MMDSKGVGGLGSLVLALAVCGTFINAREARAECPLYHASFEATVVGIPTPSPENTGVDVLFARQVAGGPGYTAQFHEIPWNGHSGCLGPGTLKFKAIDDEYASSDWQGQVTCTQEEYHGPVHCSGSVTIEMHKPYTQDANDPSHRPRESTSPDPPCSAVGNPVSVVTGNMFLDQTDAVVPGWGLGLNLTRSYNSARRGYQGAFGAGWTHSYEKELEVMETAVLMIREGDGVATFYWDSDSDQTFELSLRQPRRAGSWNPAVIYTRNFPDGSHETYDGSGNLTSMVDAVGNTVSLACASDRLTSVTDPAGRQLTFTYSGTHITSASGPGGPVAVYTYSGNNLKTVTYPRLGREIGSEVRDGDQWALLLWDGGRRISGVEL